MCGLTGIFDVAGTWSADALAAAAARMAATLRHRGPDDGGVWVDGPAGVALGFRRLAILDLSPHGHQPMVSDSGRYVLTFNGEIYNVAEVRRELDALGDEAAVAYRGRSDTEVMLRAFDAWGVHDAVPRFAGMFACAVWDRRRRTLHLCRDRLGEKPLYYGWSAGAFVFGSELKALAAVPGFDARIDREAVGAFLRYGYIPTPQSIYVGIRKLLPGTVLSLSRGDDPGASPEPRAYWSAKEAAEAGLVRPFDGSDEEAVEQLDALLRRVIADEMVADVPLGAFLSGGIDSSTIVSIMQSLSRRPVRTFTIGFHEDHYDEASHARCVAAHLGTDHIELYVTPKIALSVIPRLPELYDEPFADSSQIPTFLVSELARRDVTVSLSGDGGDELFAGYGWYGRTDRIWRQMSRVPRPLRRAAAAGLAALSPTAWDRIFKAARPMLPERAAAIGSGDRVHKLAGIVAGADSAESVHDGLVTSWQGDFPLLGGPPRPRPSRQRWAARVHPIERLMYHDAICYLPDDILAKVDRATMAVSLESRAPLLDHRVYEFAWRLPLALKMRDGRGKWPLRQVLHRFVPRQVVDRPKMGFCVPIDSWLRGPLRDWAEDLLHERRLRREGFFDPAPVAQRWGEHLSGRRNWPHHLWNLLMFQAWLDSRPSGTAAAGGGVDESSVSRSATAAALAVGAAVGEENGKRCASW
jgi:asparagine synthase (glutamine-hydrolysing)